ncbi:MAG TPA: DUF1326 domain-containing protein [Steroidobacteraceae bacterium]|nr:DUF1326 domain-containing protein [Steroidobacteraceae bacterium]
MTAWRVTGSYFEVCNCDAPCACRKIGDRPGGAFPYETCDFALSWRIEQGHFGATSLNDLSVAMAGRWDHAEPPWHVIVYVDDRASAAQRHSLEEIFLGRAGGTPAKNYAAAIGQVHAVRAARIELDHTRGKERMKIGAYIDAATAHPLNLDKPVSCGIAGHDHPGQEVVASHMRVTDPPLQWTVDGRCGFATEFDYRSN